MATSKLPLPVSITVAVVSTRVWPLMLPPTMIEAPTSEITPPKPAMTAARSGSRASLSSSHTICGREAPRARICRRSPGGRCCRAARLMPAMMGEAMMAWARIMAEGVYRMPSEPSGPLRQSSTVTKRPTTTGGRPMPVFSSAMTSRLPGNSFRATATATVRPMARLIRVATPETCRDSQVIRRTSGSSVSSSSSAFRRPSQIRSIPTRLP